MLLCHQGETKETVQIWRAGGSCGLVPNDVQDVDVNGHMEEVECVECQEEGGGLVLKALLIQCAVETVALLADQGKKKVRSFIDEMMQSKKEISITFHDRMNKGWPKSRVRWTRTWLYVRNTCKRI